MDKKDNTTEQHQWQINVPIFRNTVILKQLGIAIGIPFGLLTVILTLMPGKRIYTLYALVLIGVLLLFTWIFVMVVYHGKYEVEFILNGKGVLCRTQPRQLKKNRIINALTIMLGFLSNKPTVTGAGMLAEAKQAVYLRWNKITKVKYMPHKQTIILRGGWTESIGLFCTKENYNMIELYVKNRTRGGTRGQVNIM